MLIIIFANRIIDLVYTTSVLLLLCAAFDIRRTRSVALLRYSGTQELRTQVHHRSWLQLCIWCDMRRSVLIELDIQSIFDLRNIEATSSYSISLILGLSQSFHRKSRPARPRTHAVRRTAMRQITGNIPLPRRHRVGDGFSLATHYSYRFTEFQACV